MLVNGVMAETFPPGVTPGAIIWKQQPLNKGLKGSQVTLAFIPTVKPPCATSYRKRPPPMP